MKFAKKTSILFSLMTLALLFACRPGSESQELAQAGTTKELQENAQQTMRDVFDLSADQKAMVRKLGPPESFKLIFSKEGDKTVRIESWNYYRFKTRIAFIDGAIETESEIDDVPNWTLLPVDYLPEQFTNGMSLEEVKQRILGDRPFESIDLQADQLPGTQLQVIGSDQIVMGFEQGKLIYAETVPLVPNEDEAIEEGAE